MLLKCFIQCCKGFLLCSFPSEALRNEPGASDIHRAKNPVFKEKEGQNISESQKER